MAITVRLALLICLLLTGCVSYKHEATRPDGTTDTTRFFAFLFVGTAGKIRSDIRDGTNYHRTVSVGELGGKGDSGMAEAIASGVVRGLKASGGVP